MVDGDDDELNQAVQVRVAELDALILCEVDHILVVVTACEALVEEHDTEK